MPAPLQTGTLLLASQELQNDYFSRCVIIVIQHSPKNGTMGLVLNRPLCQKIEPSNLTELSTLFGIPSIKNEINNFISEGGPVDQDYLFFLHRVNHIITNGKLITNDLYWGGNIDKSIPLSYESNIENRICFYRGYAGWDKDQLEQEIYSGAWILAPCNTSTILSQSPETMWHDLLYKLGGHYRAMAEIPEDPSVN